MQSDICFKTLARSQAPVILIPPLLKSVYYCEFLFSHQTTGFSTSLGFSQTCRVLIILDFLSFPLQTPFQSPQPPFSKLTFLHSQGIRNLNAVASLPKNVYLCIGNGRKGSISRMSDECRKDVRWKKEDGRCCYTHSITPLILYH